ncbi:MAG: phosphoribosyltransferase family protein [Bacteroidota bacterium]
MKKTLQSIWSGMLHFVYPRLCIGCNKSLLDQEQILCLECANELPLTNYHHIQENETASRFAGRIKFNHATSFAYFSKDGLLQKLLHEFKYKNNKAAGVFMARRFAYALQKTDWIKEIDLLIPVPLYRSKLNERGYNQSEIIAKTLSSVLRIEIDIVSLARVTNTDSQVRKSRADRAKNMNHAFSVGNMDNLKGKHILIIDDVLTTGATIEACSAALQSVEGLQFSIATVGIAID